MSHSISNLHSLPSHVVEHTKLSFRKKQLAKDICEINAQLKVLEQKLIADMGAEDRGAYEICPSAEEEKVVGATGMLQLKVKNEYERMSQDNLIVFCTKFFRYLMPDSPDEDVTKLGYGSANWIWNNRARQPKKYLERVYIQENKPIKRKTPDEEKAKVARIKKPTPSNVPKTRDEFLGISSFHDVLMTTEPGSDEEPDSTDI